MHFPPGPVTSPATVFLTRFTVPGMCSLLWSRSQINQKTVGDPYIGHATVIQVGLANSFILLGKSEHFLTENFLRKNVSQS